MGFVFAIKTLVTGEIVSGGDDCTLRIWDPASGKSKQSIQLPRTIWAINQNSLGDLLVGTEDYKIRTFTRDPSRADTGEELKTFENEVTSQVNSTDLAQFEKAPDISEQGKIQGKGEGDI